MNSAATATIPRGCAPNPILAFRRGSNLQTTSQTTPTVFVIDDDISVRQSLEMLIRSQGWQVQTFESAQDFLTRPRCLAPSCLILAFSTTDLNDLEVQKRIARERAAMPIIIISGNRDVPTTVKAIKAGAVDFLVKPLRGDLLLGAIRQGLILSHVALGREMEICALRNCYASLTSREREVMILVVSGLPNKLVGGELGISEITVKTHRGNVMRKMKADSFAQLVNMASRLRVTRSLRPAQSQRDNHGLHGTALERTVISRPV